MAADSTLETPRLPKSCSLNGNCPSGSSLVRSRYWRMVCLACQLVVATVTGYQMRSSMVSRYDGTQNAFGSVDSMVIKALWVGTTVPSGTARMRIGISPAWWSTM
jgi:hypothetical protein